MVDGENVWIEDQLLVLERAGFAEECHFNLMDTLVPPDHLDVVVVKRLEDLDGGSLRTRTSD